MPERVSSSRALEALQPIVGMSDIAIEGGSPVRTEPLPAWPSYSESEITAARNVLHSGLVNSWTGDECRHFETEFAAHFGIDHAVALANGTVSLELALRILGIGAGDEVIVTARSFFASASAIVLCGAVPVFADIDRESQNVTVDTLSAQLTSKTRALIVVHLAGWPCDMPAIVAFAREHSLSVIEDCAQAHGARVDTQLAGTFGDVGVFSFCQDKIMSTAGEGGMLITPDEALWTAAWSFKDHGKAWERVHETHSRPGFRWLHEGFGSNYRMTEVQGAIGRIQLRKLDEWVTRRRENAARLMEGLSDVDVLRIPRPSEREYHSFYKFYAFVRRERMRSGWSRDEIIRALEAEGIPGWSGSCPEIYREPAFKEQSQPVLPVARELGETSIMLPVHPTLSDRDVDDIALAVRRVCARASQ